MMSMRRAIAGKTPAEIRAMSKEMAKEPTSMQVCGKWWKESFFLIRLMVFCFSQDILEALKKVSPSVNLDDIHKYEKWMRDFGSV